MFLFFPKLPQLYEKGWQVTREKGLKWISCDPNSFCILWMRINKWGQILSMEAVTYFLWLVSECSLWERVCVCDFWWHTEGVTGLFAVFKLRSGSSWNSFLLISFPVAQVFYLSDSLSLSFSPSLPHPHSQKPPHLISRPFSKPMFHWPAARAQGRGNHAPLFIPTSPPE